MKATIDQIEQILAGELNHGFLIYKNAENRAASYEFVMEDGIPRVFTEDGMPKVSISARLPS